MFGEVGVGGLHFCVQVTVWRGYYDTYKVLPGSLVCIVVSLHILCKVDAQAWQVPAVNVIYKLTTCLTWVRRLWSRRWTRGPCV